MNDDAVTVTELASLDEVSGARVAERLARWHAEEWAHLYHPEVWNEQVARREFDEQRQAGGGEAPTTYVALDTEGEVVGSVSLVTNDDLAGFDHLGPWLASLFVAPPWRRRGIGRRLIAHLLAQRSARSVTEVYLFTADHASWYRGLGWDSVTDTVTGPSRTPVTVMRFARPGASVGDER